MNTYQGVETGEGLRMQSLLTLRSELSAGCIHIKEKLRFKGNLCLS